MGRISDGTFDFYGKKQGQYDITKDPNWLARANQNASFAMGITQAVTNSVFTFVNQMTDIYGNDSSTSKVNPNHDGELGATGKEIEAEIKQTLNGVGYNDIASLNAGIESKQIEVGNLEKDIATKVGEIETAEGEVSRLDTELKKFDGKLLSDTDRSQYQNLLKEYAKALKKRNTLIKEKEALVKQKGKLNIELDKLNQAKVKVDQLQAALIKAEKQDGKDVIENMTNQDTKEFTTLLGDLRKAIATGDQKKIDKVALALETQYQEYSKGKSDIPIHIKNGYNIATRYINTAKANKNQA